jgi:sulfoxide reductase heme-binding subunit YedZ
MPWHTCGTTPCWKTGWLALLLLVPLAATSTRGWQQRLGRRWRALHRLVYAAVPLAVWHYLWLDRDIITLPVLYAALVAVLFLLRVPAVRQALRRLAGRRT